MRSFFCALIIYLSMSLSFLPKKVQEAISNINYGFLSEIRLKRGQPVIVEYKGEYKYLTRFGIADSGKDLIICEEVESVIMSATDGCIYNYTEQMKNGFITVQHGVRIGIAGEYVTLNGEVQTIKNITSLNIRIPHIIHGCADFIVENLFCSCLHSTLLYSKPGLGKTTMLRDIAIKLSKDKKNNILIFDERSEIAAIDGNGNGFDLGDRVDVVRCNNKLGSIASAIRAMKPQVIITDELYGRDDVQAMHYAVDCGIFVIASSHICNRDLLKKMPFEYFVELTEIGSKPKIYDKNFNAYSRGGAYNFNRDFSVGK